MTPPILARVAAQFQDTTDQSNNKSDTITTTSSWEYIPKSSSLSDLTKLTSSAHPSSSTNFFLQDHTQAQPIPPAPPPQQLPHGITQLPSNYTRHKNPVLRSASFNVHGSEPAVRRTGPPRIPRQKHAQQAIVLVAENPLNGASEVYNVPFQQDIYSLPIDSLSKEKPPARWSSLSSHNATNSFKPGTRKSVAPLLPPVHIPPTPPTRKTKETVPLPPHRTVSQSSSSSNPPTPPKRTNNPAPPVPPTRLHAQDKKRSKSVDPSMIPRQQQHELYDPRPPPDSSSSPSIRSTNPLGLSFLNLFRRNRGARVSLEEAAPETPYYFRELPPPPPEDSSQTDNEEDSNQLKDFAASIDRVKDCGWYWGPLSSEDAEELLKNEPDGSFIVRDSSDARYIFSLTFKLHGLVRHVRIEHDQGNFSFGPLTRFKANTIVDFVEKAVAHSRSGRYLFFLHRRPVLGPMQVQLLHPYSRFMHPRSLKHMCRFVILKQVRRDLIHTLPLPKPLQDYLNTPHYYFENGN